MVYNMCGQQRDMNGCVYGKVLNIVGQKMSGSLFCHIRRRREGREGEREEREGGRKEREGTMALTTHKWVGLSKALPKKKKMPLR